MFSKVNFKMDWLKQVRLQKSLKPFGANITKIGSFQNLVIPFYATTERGTFGNCISLANLRGQVCS